MSKIKQIGKGMLFKITIIYITCGITLLFMFATILNKTKIDSWIKLNIVKDNKEVFENDDSKNTEKANYVLPSLSEEYTEMQNKESTITEPNIDTEKANIDLVDDVTLLMIESKELYEKATKETDLSLKAEYFKEVDKLCILILQDNSDNLQITKRAMYSNIELGKLFSEKNQKIEYFNKAKQNAYNAMQISIDKIESQNAQYFYAQCVYEIAKVLNDEESIDLYMESFEYFSRLLEYEPFWSRHYLFSICRKLYNETNNIEYLQLIMENESLVDLHGLESNSKFDILVEISDVYFLLGKYYSEYDSEISVKLLEESKETIQIALLIKESHYLENQLKLIEKIFH